MRSSKSKGPSKSEAREAERTVRLLRRLDLEEVLADLGIDVIDEKGADVYAECPDPDHVDGNPSFHVCVEEVFDSDGRNRLGWFNCWSHDSGDGQGLRGLSFLDLVARVREGIWDRWPTREERDAAAAFLRATYVRDRPAGAPEELALLARRRLRWREQELAELRFPPARPVAEADRIFRDYLRRRGFPLARAAELGVTGARRAGPCSNLRNTVPAVLFPIRVEGEVVNWFARAVGRVEKRDKGRYAPGRPIGSAGVFWDPDGADFAAPVALTEGLLDAERVRRVVADHPDLEVEPRNVLAVLGGSLHRQQAARLRACPRVYLLGDGDRGGKHLLDTASALLGGVVLDARTPPGTDPDDAPLDALLRVLQPPDFGGGLGVRFRGRSSVVR